MHIFRSTWLISFRCFVVKLLSFRFSPFDLGCLYFPSSAFKFQLSSVSSEMTLYINALPLELGGFGIGAYTRDLILGLGRSQVASQIVLICPFRLAENPTILASGLKVKKIGLPFWVPRKLSDALWPEMVGWWLAQQSNSIFFSPAQFYSLFVPQNVWVTCHDCMPLHFPVYLGKNPLRKWRYYRGLRYLARCQGVITDSEASKGDIERMLGIPRERIHVVTCWESEMYSIAKGAELRARVRTTYGLPERYWLYLGGYDIRKNVEFLIRSYAAVRATRELPPLVLAGKIPERQHPTLCDVRGAIQVTGLSDREIMTPGFIADEDLPGLYAGAELFLYPSRGEGFGLPPLEAMSCGCPAIVGDNTSLREVVADDGYRFSTNDGGSELEALLRQAAEAPLPLNPKPRDFSMEKSLDRLIRVLGVKLAKQAEDSTTKD